MAYRPYPPNPAAVPTHGAPLLAGTQHYATQPAHQPAHHGLSAHMTGMSVATTGAPPRVPGGGGGRAGGPLVPSYPAPPTNQAQPAVNSLSSGVQQMHIGAPPGRGLLHPGPPIGQPYSAVQGLRPGQATFPPPLNSGQQYAPPTSSVATQPRPHGSGQGLGQTLLGQGSVLPPPPQTSSMMTVQGGGVPPPVSSGQLSRQSSGQVSRQTSGQFSRQSSGQLSRQTSGQGLLPTPQASGQGLLPPPTSGQVSGHGLLPSPPIPPPPTSGHGILPNPQSGHGLLPPPTGQPLPLTAPLGHVSGQGLLPPPTSGQVGLSASLKYPPPPSSSGPLAGQPPTQNYYSGQGILSPPPVPGQSGPPSGQIPPPTSGHALGQGSMSGSLPPPPAQMMYQPPGSGQAGTARPQMGRPPPAPGGMLGLAPPPPPTSTTAPSTTAPSTHPRMSHPPQPHPQPPQAPKPHPTAADPELKPINLMETRNVMPPTPLTPPKIVLPGGLGVFSPNPDVMCSTMNAVPTTSSLLNKMKLPLAIHIHPYKDLSMQECPVIHPSVIVRCRVCRAYINPFVVFIDSRHWRCNLCFRPNTLPEEFDYNPHTGKHGERSQRMEIKRSSVEYIAPSEYMLRPPQPCVYYFLIDVSYNSVHSGVLAVACRCLLENLGHLPGDARTLVGFLTYDSSLHFYNLSAANCRPQMMVVSDVDDAFLPSPDSLLVNLKECKDMVQTLLEDLPGMFEGTSITHSGLGAALTMAEKLLHSIGGRVTVIQASLPSVGPGALKYRDINPSATKKDTLNMAPGSDFYKTLSLELSSQQIAVDLFSFSSQFIDLATISCVSKFSSGQVFYYPEFNHSKQLSRQCFEKDFSRYLTRKVGFEAVMRIRCTEGISLHTFHGNFFVRSTDLLSLPNTNPDHGYTINLAIDESLKDMGTVCVQAALLYTSNRGERRIRVHTLCLPVSSQLSVLYSKLNVHAITGVLANMAVDRAVSSNLGDAREALMNTLVDSTKMFRSQLSSTNSATFTLPSSLAQLPLLTLSLLKNPAFTLSSRISYDVRTQAMNLIKSHPLSYLLPTIYPHLYALHLLTEKDVVEGEDGQHVVSPPLLQLSAENMSRYGIFLMDCGLSMYIWVSKDAPPQLISKIFGIDGFESIPEMMTDIPLQENESSKLVNQLIKQIRTSRQHFVSLQVIREGGPQRLLFVERLLDGKTEDGTSYYEFLSHVHRQIGK